MWLGGTLLARPLCTTSLKDVSSLSSENKVLPTGVGRPFWWSLARPGQGLDLNGLLHCKYYTNAEMAQSSTWLPNRMTTTTRNQTKLPEVSDE